MNPVVVLMKFETWSFEQRHRLQIWHAGQHHFECAPVVATSHFEQVAKFNCVASRPS